MAAKKKISKPKNKSNPKTKSKPVSKAKSASSQKAQSKPKPKLPVKKKPAKKKLTRPSIKPAPIETVEPVIEVVEIIEIQIDHDAIAKRAYEIWEAKGRPEGDGSQNWTEAEAQLRAAILNESE